MILKLIAKFLPRQWYVLARNFRTLAKDFGMYRSARDWSAVDRLGNPIPWYSYPAIEYLNQLDFCTKSVFEYGSGNSTLYWAARCKSLVAIEDHPEWFGNIRSQLPGNVDYRLFPEKDRYVEAINGFGDPFNVIIVDGNHRNECARQARRKLADDGIIILDNSDWYEETAKFLRSTDLIEVDMSGFGPINFYTSTTSFFFTRQVQLVSRHDRQPVHGIGSLPHREKK